MCITDSLCWIAETNNTVCQLYSNINLFFLINHFRYGNNSAVFLPQPFTKTIALGLLIFSKPRFIFFLGDHTDTLPFQSINQNLSHPLLILSGFLFHTLYLKYFSDWLINSDLVKNLNTFNNCTRHT